MIRRYLAITGAVLLLFAMGALVGYQWFFHRQGNQQSFPAQILYGVSRRFRIGEQGIERYAHGEWHGFRVRGIQLSSFYPGYERNRSGIKTEVILAWLETIADLGANTIQIPYLQPPGFYRALYDFNLGREEPLYILHSIPIDAETALVFYDAYQPEIVKNMLADMRTTVDALHGNAVVWDNSRHHGGLYLKDVSPYILGFLVGDNTSAEVITLTNQRYSDITEYAGEYYAVESSTAFGCFVAENLNYLREYEQAHYSALSLYSYLSSPETDPLEHRNETNVTRNADIDIDDILCLREDMRNLMACYAAHPNSPDFLDYEMSYDPVRRGDDAPSAYRLYLERLAAHHDTPVLITGTGIPASRGISRVDLDDGYDRGGHTEQEQGMHLIRLLKDVEASGCDGVVIQSFQDDWSLHTSANMRNFSNEDSTPYWQDVQASDECLGLIAFLPDKHGRIFTVDGDPSEWQDTAPLYDKDGIRVYAGGDNSYLYLMAHVPGLKLQEDILYIPLDITPKSGAVRWEDQDLNLPFPADFIIHFDGYNESRIVVQDRYNLFQYRYMYYSYVLDKQVEMPRKDEPSFRSIHQMNRYNILLKGLNELAPPIYYQTGRLTYGTADPSHGEYNSLTDFSKDGDVLEVRIPWSLINVRDPMRRMIQRDFYAEGLNGEIRIDRIALSLIFHDMDGEWIQTGAFSYRLPRLHNHDYQWRLRLSAGALKEYWQGA